LGIRNICKVLLRQLDLGTCVRIPTRNGRNLPPSGAAGFTVNSGQQSRARRQFQGRVQRKRRGKLQLGFGNGLGHSV
jgi:hypothetical protein